MWMPPIQSSEHAPLGWVPQHPVQETGTLGQILIVDDSREAGWRRPTCCACPAMAFELVADGRAALQAVELHQPDLIILDVQLPGIDGYAVCDALKRNPATWQIPIIMVTVEGERKRGCKGSRPAPTTTSRSRPTSASWRRVFARCCAPSAATISSSRPRR